MEGESTVTEAQNLMEGTKTRTGTLFEPLDDILLTNRTGSTVSSPSSHSLHRGDIVGIVGAPCTVKTHTYFFALTTLVPSLWEARIRPIAQFPHLAATGENGENSADSAWGKRKRSGGAGLRWEVQGEEIGGVVAANLDVSELSEETNMGRYGSSCAEASSRLSPHLPPPPPPQLTATVRSLPPYLRAEAPGKEIAFLLVDGLSALHILPSTTTMNSDLVPALHKVRLHTGWITLITSWASHRSPAVPTLPSHSSSSSSTPQQHLVQPLSEAHWVLTAQIVTSRFTYTGNSALSWRLQSCMREQIVSSDDWFVTASKVFHLIALFGPKDPWRTNFISSVLIWTAKTGTCPAGDLDVHAYIGEMYYKETSYQAALGHLLLSPTSSSALTAAEMLFNWSKLDPAGEVESAGRLTSGYNDGFFIGLPPTDSTPPKTREALPSLALLTFLFSREDISQRRPAIPTEFCHLSTSPRSNDDENMGYED
ncbi:hypothetical protein BT69DRAFT_1337114 [Atractiella rhizophila]|nr:hypothetical protein BT69DRAFT_1337114 [Atractiella rhizophila]